LCIESREGKEEEGAFDEAACEHGGGNSDNDLMMVEEKGEKS